MHMYERIYFRGSEAVNNDTEFKTEAHCQHSVLPVNPVFFCDIVYKEIPKRRGKKQKHQMQSNNWGDDSFHPKLKSFSRLIKAR